MIPLTAIPFPYKILAAGAALIGVFGFGLYSGAKYEINKYEAANAAQKVEAAEKLAVETAKATAKEKSLIEEKAKLEKRYEQRLAAREKELADARRAVAAAGGLRDPGRRESGSGAAGTNPASAGSGNESPGSGELSEQAVEFLLRFAAEADAVVDQLRACQEDDAALREILGR